MPDPALDDRDLDVLARLVARHSTAVLEERHVPAQTEMRSVEMDVEEPYEKTIEEKSGIPPYVVAAAVVSGLVGIVVPFIFGGVAVVASVLIIAAGLGWLYMASRPGQRTVEATRTVRRVVEREVEVEPARTETVEVPSSKKVRLIGRGAVRVRGIPSFCGTFAVADEPWGDRVDITLPTLANPDGVFDARQEMGGKLLSIPWVLSSEGASFVLDSDDEYESEVPLHGLEADIRVYLDHVTDLMEDRREYRGSLLLVRDPLLLSALEPISKEEAATKEHLDGEADIEALNGLMASPNGVFLGREAAAWTPRWDRTLAGLYSARTAALCEHATPSYLDLGTQLGYSAFNFFCPSCNESNSRSLLSRDYSVHSSEPADPITFSATTRCLFDPSKNVWRCRSCERETVQPIPIHRVLDGVLLPAYDHLMQEHEVERVKAHRDVRMREDEIRSGLEEELLRLQTDQFQHIHDLSDQLQRYEADIAGESEAIESMQEVLAMYQLKQTTVMADIRTFSAGVERAIAEQTASVLSGVDDVMKTEMQELTRELEELSRAKRIDDERRDAVQREVLRSSRDLAEINKAGFASVTGAVKENTAVTKEGLSNVTSAVKENTEVTREGLSNVTGAVKENTEVTREGLSNVTEQVAKGNAMRAAYAKKQGIDLHDYNGFLHPVRALSDMGTTVVGRVTGQDTMRIESKKFKGHKYN